MNLREKLNDMFDIEGAVITKKQSCRVGRWLFTLALSVLFCALYAVCMWGALRFYVSTRIFLIAVLTLALAFMLFRLWFAFGVDVASGKFAERTEFMRSGDKRYYYTCGKYLKKFEYDGGFIAALGKSYDKFQDKSDYSPLAGRFNRSLQRRSSLFVTMSPSFWFDMISCGNYTLTEKGVVAKNQNGEVLLVCGNDGKIKRIEYKGNGYYLYDSASPIKIFDGKIPGNYRITYSFEVGAIEHLEVDGIFGEAIKDFLMPPPPSADVTFSVKTVG